MRTDTNCAEIATFAKRSDGAVDQSQIGLFEFDIEFQSANKIGRPWHLTLQPLGGQTRVVRGYRSGSTQTKGGDCSPPLRYSYPKICEPGAPTFLPDLIEAGGDKPPGAGS